MLADISTESELYLDNAEKYKTYKIVDGVAANLDATQTVSLNGASNGFGYDVADNGSYIGRFVVEAEKANVTYGLDYEYQKGDSVKANKWMANVNWSF